MGPSKKTVQEGKVKKGGRKNKTKECGKDKGPLEIGPAGPPAVKAKRPAWTEIGLDTSFFARTPLGKPWGGGGGREQSGPGAW